MPAPSKNFTTIADSQVDGSSPLDTTLVTGLRDNDQHLEEWLGKDFIAAQNHSHNNADSARVKEADLDRQGGVRVFDDFLLNSLSAGLWTVVTAVIIEGVNGVARITGLGSIRTIDFTCFKLGNHTVTFEAFVKHGTSGPIQRIGLKDSNAATQSNEVIFGYYASASNWWVQNSIGGVTTITDTGVAISTTAFQKIKFVATLTSVAFYINDVLKATHTTNIPTANMGILIYSDGQLDVDYVDCRSTSRV